MFEFLRKISDKIYSRYLTVERNIRSASNSFYDSFLDLQEELVKFVAINEMVDLGNKRTCGDILKLEEIKKIFLEKYLVNDNAFEKMKDYTLKVNAHKHKNEKKIQVDTIISYLRIFYEVSSKVALYLGIAAEEFSENYIMQIFGILEKENFALKEENQKIRDDLRESVDKIADIVQDYQRQIDQKIRQNNAKQNDEYGLNRTNQKLAMEQFFKTSQKFYAFPPIDDEYKKEKRKTLIIALTSISIAIISTIVTVATIGFYSTYTLFENIWIIFELCLLSHVIKSKEKYDHIDYAFSSHRKFVVNKDDLYCPTKMKHRYKFFLVISCIAVIANIICIIDECGVKSIPAVIFEILFFSSSIACLWFVDNYFDGYFCIFYKGYIDGKDVTLVHDKLYNKILTEKDFYKHYEID